MVPPSFLRKKLVGRKHSTDVLDRTLLCRVIRIRHQVHRILVLHAKSPVGIVHEDVAGGTRRFDGNRQELIQL